MPKDYTAFQTKTIGATLKQAVLDYYSPLADTDMVGFDWLNILNYVDDNGVQVNRDVVSNANMELSKSDNSITDANGYPSTPTSVTENSRIASLVLLTIGQTNNATINQIKRNKLYTGYDSKKFHSVTSAIFSNYIKDILADDMARPFYSPIDFQSSRADKINVANVSHRVFIVSKALGNKVVNASPYIIDSTWNDDFNGGNFSVTLASPTAHVSNGQWVPSNVDVQITGFGELEIRHSDALDSYRILNRDMGNDPIISFRKMYFDMVLQKYDVVFIRGEKMLNEAAEFRIDTLNEPFDVSLLEGKNWDMIGLVDKTTVNYQLSNGMVGFNFSGRDLMAILIETQNINLPNVSVTGGSTEITGFLQNYIENFNEANKSHTIDRLFGSLTDISKAISQPIATQINWVFDKWQHCPFTTDYQLFSEFKVNNPFVSDQERNFAIYNPTGGKYERLGVWNMMSVWVDENVSSRYINDASFANQNGMNLISYIKKIVQPPVAEFFTVQMGSYHHWIIRKPPYDFDSYRRLFDMCNTNKSHVVSADMIYSLSLEYDVNEVPSIYRFVPTETLFGESSREWLYPAIAIPELMDRFDAKTMEITHNYLDARNVQQSFDDAIKDMEFYIRTNIYRQFSQKGQVVILGNRVIKKGQAIYLEPLDLLCYVTGVSNQFSINETSVTRTTVLNIERCIRLKYYDLYFNIVDFRGLATADATKQQKDVKLLRDNNGRPFVYDFFEKKLDQDYNNNYDILKNVSSILDVKISIQDLQVINSTHI